MIVTVTTIPTEQMAPPEERLWKAVIAQTIEEWVSGPMRLRREAEKFLFENDSDFRLVCASAGMDPESLRTKLSRLRKRAMMQVDCQVAA